MASPADPSWAAPALLTGDIAALGDVGKTAALAPGSDRLFVKTFAVMNEEERQLHGLLLPMTIHTVRPLQNSGQTGIPRLEVPSHSLVRV